jgi:predicted esterase
MSADLDFVHRWVPAQQPGAPVLLMLHGTGGNEEDLLSLGDLLSPGAAMLSPRGQVLENGAPRFFRRLAEGVFDITDLHARAGDLARFVEGASKAYEFAPGSAIAVGYSNGANIASAMMLDHPGVLRGAVLFRGMIPFEPESPARLDGVKVLISNGRRDPIVPASQVSRLAEILREAGAETSVELQNAGHELTREAVDGARDWLRRAFGAEAPS